MRLPLIRVLLSGLLCFSMVIITGSAGNAASGNVKYGDRYRLNSQNQFGAGPVDVGASCFGTWYYKAVKVSEFEVKYSVKNAGTNCDVNRLAINGNMTGAKTMRVSGAYYKSGDVCYLTTTMNWTGNDDGIGWTSGRYRSEGEIPIGNLIMPGEGAPPLGGLGNDVCMPSKITAGYNGLRGALLNLGPLPLFGDGVQDSGACSNGTPKSVDAATKLGSGSTLGYTWEEYQVEWKEPKGALGGWTIREVYVDPSQTVPMAASATVKQGGPDAMFTDGQGRTGFGRHAFGGLAPALNRPARHILGYTVSASNSPGNNNWAFVSTAAGMTSTVPDRCVFYFGVKAFDDGGPGGPDEPYGDSGAQAEPEPFGDELPPVDAVDPSLPDEACNFDLLDPGSWLSGGMCSLVGLMGRLVNLVGSMLAALIGLPAALVDLIAASFIPDPSTWGTGDLKDQFMARPPGSVMMAGATGIQSAAGSYGGAGCGSIIDMNIGSGTAHVSCSTVKSVPGYSALYSVVQIGLIALTGLGIFRLFSGAFSDESSG